jgi:hypothetical protein
MGYTRSNLEAARIYQLDKDGNEDKSGICVSCMFNPYQYEVRKTNSYTDDPKNNSAVPQIEFKSSGPQTLTLSLFFDTYEEYKSGERINKTEDFDVSLITRKLWQLMDPKTNKSAGKNNKIPPPQVAFQWGNLLFKAVITSMTQKFTMFSKDGTPVRATVDITFQQYRDFQKYGYQNPTSGGGPVHGIRRVVAGDRLDTIAQESYGDSSKWRLIAEHNHISNPLGIFPGQQLTIPLDN